jgi:tetratricopeptide (TPR) repeat protein
MIKELKSHAKEYPRAYESAGDFYFRLGDGAEAIRQYEEGITAGVGEKEKYQKRISEVYMAQGKREEARKVNDEIREADPKDPDALALQAIPLLDKGEIQQAIDQLRTVILRAPENFVAHYNLGRGLLLKGEVEPARQQFQEAIRFRPNYIVARVALAQVELSRREYQKALKTAEDTLSYDRNNVPSRLIRSAANLGLGNRDLARQELDSVLQVQSTNKDALFQLGLANALDKRYKEAEEAYRKCYDLSPANARGLMGLVEVVMVQNQPERALKILDEEIAKYPTRLEFRIAKANVCARNQEYDRAISEYNWLLDRLDKKSPMAGDVYMRLGETQRRKGDVNTAIDSLQKAKTILPSNTVVLNTLALMLDGAGRKQEARAAYEETLKVEADNAIILNNLAFLIANSPDGNLDQALGYAQRAKQKLPQVPEVADTLGLIYLKKNLADDAIQIFRQCVTQSPNHPTFRYHLGMALHMKGDMAKAKEELTAALHNKPSKDEEKDIKDLLAKIG